jgi:hypothetical protein
MASKDAAKRPTGAVSLLFSSAMEAASTFKLCAVLKTPPPR